MFSPWSPAGRRRSLLPPHAASPKCSFPHHHLRISRSISSFSSSNPHGGHSRGGRGGARFLLQLNACSNDVSLFSSASGVAKTLHALTIVTGAATTMATFFYNDLISRYASSGGTELEQARMLFDRMPHRNVVSYNSMMRAYSRAGNTGETFRLLSEMMLSGLRPTDFTFGGILSSPWADLHLVLQLQPLVLKTGLLHGSRFSGTALLGVFGRHGRVEDSWKIFQEMQNRSVATWNSMITELSRRRLNKDAMLLFRELLRTGIVCSEYSFPGVLSAIDPSDGSEFGEQLHALAIRTGLDSHVAIGNALINMYSTCAGASAAERMFMSMSERDLVSWNTVIAAFSTSGRPVGALNLFSTMPFLGGFSPNESTFASVLKACTDLKMMPELGEFVHAKATKLGLDMDVFVASSLVDFYGKCRSLYDARVLFDEVTNKNVVTWNALLGGYSSGGSRDCVVLLQEMLRSGVRPNEFSFSPVLKWSSMSELLQLHSLIVKMGCDGNEYVSSAMAAAYAARGEASGAVSFASSSSVSSLPVAIANVFGGIHNRDGDYEQTKNLISHVQEPNPVSWNIFMTACARSGDYEEALRLFRCMHASTGPPDCYAAVSVLSICTKLNDLMLGSSIHGLMVKGNVRSFDVFVHNVLLDMYAKCGSLEGSRKVFEEMDERNLVSWTALISALGLHGRAHDALLMFKQMVAERFWPDHVSFVAVLSACRHGGLLEEGMSLFKCMKVEYGIEPDMDHYICVVDLLCRCGRLKEAEDVISSMPFQPNSTIWRIFLKGCRNFAKADQM